MATPHAVITVFTFRSLENILQEGGSQAWTCKQETARACQYVVITRNRNGVPAAEGRPGLAAMGNEPHGTAFMIGRIKDVVLSEDHKPGETPRYMIQIDRWAPLNIANVWQGWRLPFKYMSLEEAGIDDVDALDWQDMPVSTDTAEPAVSPAAGRSIEAIANELKSAIAQQRKVPIKNVELRISVRETVEFSL